MDDACSVLVARPLAVSRTGAARCSPWRRGQAWSSQLRAARQPSSSPRRGAAFAPACRSPRGSRHGQATRFDVVVWDESHRLKNPAAARSELAARITQSAGFALWVAATAGQNPLELSYLAPLLARVTGDRPGDLADFEAWCAGAGLGDARRVRPLGLARRPRRCDKVRAMLFDGAPAAGIGAGRNIASWPELNAC
jgi:hypothetical protein